MSSCCPGRRDPAAWRPAASSSTHPRGTTAGHSGRPITTACSSISGWTGREAVGWGSDRRTLTRDRPPAPEWLAKLLLLFLDPRAGGRSALVHRPLVVLGRTVQGGLVYVDHDLVLLGPNLQLGPRHKDLRLADTGHAALADHGVGDLAVHRIHDEGVDLAHVLVSGVLDPGADQLAGLDGAVRHARRGRGGLARCRTLLGERFHPEQ